MIELKLFETPSGQTRRMYENRVPVGARQGDNTTNTDLASNQLVQFFLRVFYRHNQGLLRQLPPTRSGDGFLLDGDVGAQTIAGIKLFQFHVRNRGIPLIVDSRVSVADGILIPGTEHRWTIHALNSIYISLEKDHDKLFENAEIRSKAPQLTKELLLEEQLLRAKV
jgi:hypothetical protein